MLELKRVTREINRNGTRNRRWSSCCVRKDRTQRHVRRHSSFFREYIAGLIMKENQVARARRCELGRRTPDYRVIPTDSLLGRGAANHRPVHRWCKSDLGWPQGEKTERLVADFPIYKWSGRTPPPSPPHTPTGAECARLVRAALRRLVRPQPPGTLLRVCPG